MISKITVRYSLVGKSGCQKDVNMLDSSKAPRATF